MHGMCVAGMGWGEEGELRVDEGREGELLAGAGRGRGATGGRGRGRGANRSDDYRAVNWHAKTFLNICSILFKM